MMNGDEVFEMFRCCITEPGCGGCTRAQCYTLNNRKVEIPADLALDVCDLLASLLREREKTKTVGDEIEVKSKPDAEAIAKRDETGKQLREMIDQIQLIEEILGEE